MNDTALTVDQAVAEMTAPAEAAEIPQEEQEQQATPEAAAEAEPETVGEDAPEGEEPEADETQDAEEPEAAALEPPKHLDAEDREWFKGQTPEVQARFLKQEEKREAVLVKQREKVEAEARQSVDTERQQLAQIAASVRQHLPQLVAAHKSYWGENGFDLAANAREYGAEKALEMQADYVAEQQHIANLVQAQQLAEQEGLRAWRNEQYSKLIELRPEFADPKTAAPLRETLARDLAALGATPEQLEQVPAWGIDLAMDGLKYRQAQAEAKAKAKAPTKPVVAAVKPSAAQPSSSHERSLAQLKARAFKTGSVDDMVALQVAEEKAQRRA